MDKTYLAATLLSFLGLLIDTINQNNLYTSGQNTESFIPNQESTGKGKQKDEITPTATDYRFLEFPR